MPHYTDEDHRMSISLLERTGRHIAQFLGEHYHVYEYVLDRTLDRRVQVAYCYHPEPDINYAYDPMRFSPYVEFRVEHEEIRCRTDTICIRPPIDMITPFHSTLGFDCVDVTHGCCFRCMKVIWNVQASYSLSYNYY